MLMQIFFTLFKKNEVSIWSTWADRGKCNRNFFRFAHELAFNFNEDFLIGVIKKFSR